MNRENKLAVIIGFSLVLVVAVLISDHFSRARSSKIGADISAGDPQDYGAATTGLTKPIGPSEQVPVSERALTHVEPKGGSEPRTIPVNSSGQDHARADGAEDPSSQDVPSKTPDSDKPTSNKPYSRGAMKTYEVKDGDKLFRIASTFYNDGNLWHKLVEYNKGKLPRPEALRVGMKLDIPPKDVLLGEAIMPPPGVTPEPTVKPNRNFEVPERSEWPTHPKDATPAKPSNAGPKAAPIDSRTARTTDAAKPGAKKVSMETYKVERGDDLSKIAQKLLGSSRRASELYELNKDTLDDEHTLAIGTTLKIPAR